MQIGVVMDPIAHINPTKDTTLAMMHAAQQKGWCVFYMEMSDLFLSGNIPKAYMRKITVHHDAKKWFQLSTPSIRPLYKLDVILMRKDPPVDENFIYVTHLLEHAEKLGTWIVNPPCALRNFNEKIFIMDFPECTTESIVTAQIKEIRSFIKQHRKVILKPLNGMGGQSIYLLTEQDKNLSVILQNMTENNHTFVMVQKYIANIRLGDKRILMIDGKPFPYALARIPPTGEVRGNLAAGGIGKGVSLSKHDIRICEQIGPRLQKERILFAGIDVIGKYLTEINITSPTCIRELDKIYKTDIAMTIMNTIEQKYTTRKN